MMDIATFTTDKNKETDKHCHNNKNNTQNNLVNLTLLL